jgi:hypothetical protein
MGVDSFLHSSQASQGDPVAIEQVRVSQGGSDERLEQRGRFGYCASCNQHIGQAGRRSGEAGVQGKGRPQRGFRSWMVACGGLGFRQQLVRFGIIRMVGDQREQGAGRLAGSAGAKQFRC